MEYETAIRRISGLGDEHLLTPREVAALFGVRTTTIARWVREGRLGSLATPGGHRRYRPADVRTLLEAAREERRDQNPAEDTVRLYDQGWSIRQVAEKFDVDYSTMRRLLLRNGAHLRKGPSR
jgi:excisionase family DNA binding protein